MLLLPTYEEKDTGLGKHCALHQSRPQRSSKEKRLRVSEIFQKSFQLGRACRLSILNGQGTAAIRRRFSGRHRLFPRFHLGV